MTRELTYEKYVSAKKKPGPTAKARAKRKRAETPALKMCRDHADWRDGPCGVSIVGGCAGFTELMHLRPFTRAQTRGMAPEIRHQKAYTMNGCRKHHRLYDSGALEIAMFGDLGANGPKRVTLQGRVYIING